MSGIQNTSAVYTQLAGLQAYTKTQNDNLLLQQTEALKYRVETSANAVRYPKACQTFISNVV